MKEGDQNTKLFHNSVKARWDCNNFFSIQMVDGEVFMDLKDIFNEVVHFFSSLGSNSMNESQREDLLNVIPGVVSGEHNEFLTRDVSLEEVRAALFGLGVDKAPRRDGFPTLFFSICGMCLLRRC